MAKGWRNEPRRHSLASKGIKTAVNKKPVVTPKKETADVKKIKEKMLMASESRWKSRYEKTRSPSLSHLALYIEHTHPELEVTMRNRSGVTKDTNISGTRFRSAGTRDYSGKHLIVKRKSDGKTVIDHDSTETYRENIEVVEKILFYEEHGKWLGIYD